MEAGDVAQLTLDGEQVRFRRADGSDYVTIRSRRRRSSPALLMSKDIPPLRAEPASMSGYPDIPSTVACWPILRC